MLSWLSNKPGPSTEPSSEEPQTQTPTLEPGTSNPPSRSQTRSPRTSFSPTFATPYQYAGQQPSYVQDAQQPQQGSSNAYSTGVLTRPSVGETAVYGSSANIKASRKDRDKEREKSKDGDKDKDKDKERDHDRGPFAWLTTPHDAFISELYGTPNTSSPALHRTYSVGQSDRKISADQESLAWDQSSFPSSPPRMGYGGSGIIEGGKSSLPPTALNTGLSVGTAAATAPAMAASLSSSRNELVPPPALPLMSSAASHLSSTTAGTARLATPSVDMFFDPYDGTVLGSLVSDHPDETEGDDLHTMALAAAGVPGARAPSELVWSHLSRVLELQNDISRLHMQMENIGMGKDSGSAKKGARKGHHRTPSSRAGTKDDSTHGFDMDSLKTPGGTDKIPISVNTPTLPRALGKETNPYMSSVPRGKRRQRGMSTVSDLSEHSSDPDDVGNVGVSMDDGGLDMPTEEAEKKRLREEDFAKLSSQFEGRKEAIHDIMSKVDSLSKAITDFHKLHFGFPNPQQPTQGGLGGAPPISESFSDTAYLKASTSRNPLTQVSDPVPASNSISGFKPSSSTSPDRPSPPVPKTAPAHIQINPMAMGRARSDGAAMGTPVLPPVPFMVPKLGSVDHPTSERGTLEAMQRSTAESGQSSNQGAQSQALQDQTQQQQQQSGSRQRKKDVPKLLINSLDLELDSSLTRQEHLMDSPASTLGSLKHSAEDV